MTKHTIQIKEAHIGGTFLRTFEINTNSEDRAYMRCLDKINPNNAHRVISHEQTKTKEKSTKNPIEISSVSLGEACLYND